MRLLCQRTVACFGEWWSIAGWILFLSLLVTAYSARESPHYWTIVLSMLAVTTVWWIIDAVDQVVPAWMFLIAAAMLALGVFPRALLLPIACWALYWTKVRE